jgi:hypothetical protein
MRAKKLFQVSMDPRDSPTTDGEQVVKLPAVRILPLYAKKQDLRVYLRARFLRTLQENFVEQYSNIDAVQTSLARVNRQFWDDAIHDALASGTATQNRLRAFKDSTQPDMQLLKADLLAWYRGLGLDESDPDWACRALAPQPEHIRPHISEFPLIPFPSGLPAWNPVAQSKTDWVQSIQYDLMQHIESVERVAAENDFEPVPEHKSLEKHLVWVALRLVESLSVKDIADREVEAGEDVDKQSVSEALKRRCLQLELKLPPLRLGRPKK